MNPPSNPWAGRFAEAMSERLVRFNTALPIEERLFAADVRASLAHVAALEKARLITAGERELLERELGAVLEAWRSGQVRLRDELEDIHMNLEVLLTERIGEVAKKIHTARSRNDQTAVAQRLYFKESTAAVIDRIGALQRALLAHCQAHPGLLMPSYTHLQRAEITTYAHWLAAYVVMLDRDRSRMRDCLRRADECPLGACASTGTSLPLDRELTARLLGFRRPTLHSIDSVSDRDYSVEFTSHAALLMVHLSRLSEEIIVFTSHEFGFLRLADAYCTGSSIMPQKKNPDVLELVRGKAGTAIGNATSLLAMMKALSLGYNKDVQEDKRAWFSALDDSLASLEILADVVRTMEPVPARMAAACRGGHIVATEYANYLVRQGLPFRDAHGIVGGLVKQADRQGKDLAELDLAALRQGSPLFGEDVLQLTPAGIVASKNSIGSSGTEAMARLLRELEALVAD